MSHITRSLSDIRNVHDLRSIPRTRKSGKPQLATTAIMDLSMARNERERLVKERMQLTKRNIQIEYRLSEIEEEMDELLQRAKEKAREIRGEKLKTSNTEGDRKLRKGKISKIMQLGY